MLAIAETACTSNRDSRSPWTRAWVCVSDTHHSGDSAVWIWVNEVLLDSSNEAVVLDCCVMPVEHLGDAVSVRLREYIEYTFTADRGRFPILATKVNSMRYVPRPDLGAACFLPCVRTFRLICRPQGVLNQEALFSSSVGCRLFG